MADLKPSTNIPTEKSTSADWINWHKAMMGRYGKKTANTYFLKAWNARGTSSANTVDLRNYLEKKGMSIEKGAFDYTADLFDDVTSIYGGAFGFIKWVLIILTIIVLVSVAMLLFNLAKDPKTAIQAGSAIATRGASLNQ